MPLDPLKTKTELLRKLLDSGFEVKTVRRPVSKGLYEVETTVSSPNGSEAFTLQTVISRIEAETAIIDVFAKIEAEHLVSLANQEGM